METRRLGRTGHMSSVIGFGSFALLQAGQNEADAVMDLVLGNGINHMDVSPIYGNAEARIGSWIKRNGKDFFLGCKTHERTREAVWEGMKRSLETLNIDRFDLFQFHGVDDMETLDTILGPGGGLEAVLEARDQGLVGFIGITGHRPATQKEALARFDFDTVMFPLNRVHAAHREEWNDFLPLLETARKKDVGVMAIKAAAKGLWEDPEPPHPYNTWYEPFDEMAEIEKSLWYVLSQDITCAITSGDMKLLPLLIDAAKRFRPLSEQAQREIVSQSEPYRPLEGPRM